MSRNEGLMDGLHTTYVSERRVIKNPNNTKRTLRVCLGETAEVGRTDGGTDDGRRRLTCQTDRVGKEGGRVDGFSRDLAGHRLSKSATTSGGSTTQMRSIRHN